MNEAINSIENQTYKPLEVIIVNNGSKDDSKDVIHNLRNQYNSRLLKSINLEDFSVEDLEEYILTLSNEKERAKEEIKKRLKN